MIGRWLPHPFMSLLLLGVWLLLVNNASLGHILLGAVLGLVIPLLTRQFWPDRPGVHRPVRLLAYAGRVLLDIFVANFHVARLVLGPTRRLRPAFVEMPLAIRGEFAITMLASTISLTPGTVAVDVSDDRRCLLIHCLDLEDEAALIAQIRERYERPLMEIFAC